MFQDTFYMKTQDILHRSMNNSMTRRKIISDNIANADVPNFKRSEVIFESAMKRALESEKIEKIDEVPTQISDNRHIQFSKSTDYKSINPKISIDYLTTMRPDGNNVDIENEIVKSTENQMSYMIMAERYTQNSRLLTQMMRMA